MSAPTKTHVALLGLGLMGTGMARRLLAAGFRLTVYNRTVAKAAPLVAAGAKLAASPRAAAHGAHVIISMVSDVPASRSLWLGETGALAAAAPGAVLVECSTVTVAWALELAEAARARGLELLDAPVTGSRNQAAAGELNFLVGGTEATLEKIRPVLAAMSKSIVRLGPVSSGTMFKLVNNFMNGVQIAALAEALAMIERNGLDRAKAVELLVNGSAGSPMVKALAARMVDSDYQPNFPLRLMAKDLTYAWGEGNRNALDLTTAAAALEVFQRAIDAGYGEKDIAAVIEPLRSI